MKKKEEEVPLNSIENSWRSPPQKLQLLKMGYFHLTKRIERMEGGAGKKLSNSVLKSWSHFQSPWDSNEVKCGDLSLSHSYLSHPFTLQR